MAGATTTFRRFSVLSLGRCVVTTISIAIVKISRISAMSQRLKDFALGLVVFVVAAGFGGCRVPEDPECTQMREMALSGEKPALIREWIESVLADPTRLAKASRTSGPLRASNFDTGLDWDELEIPRD